MSSSKRKNGNLHVSFESPLNTTNSPAVCRICHSGENSIGYWGGDFGEPLISPCHCKGSTGLIHRSCMLYWLRTNSTRCCEICKYQFKTIRVSPSFVDFVRARGFGRYMDTNMTVDLVMFFVMTAICYTVGPLLLISASTSGDGVEGYNPIGMRSSDGPYAYRDWVAKILLAFLVFAMHLLWLVTTLTVHYMAWKRWRDANPRDVFVDRELNETFVMPNRGFLARVFCCFTYRELISGAGPSSSGSSTPYVAPVRSVYGTISNGESEPSAVALDMDANSTERPLLLDSIRPGETSFAPGSSFVPLATSSALRSSSSSGGRRHDDDDEIPQHPGSPTSRSAERSIPMRTFRPQSTSSPRQAGTISSRAESPLGLDISRTMSPLSERDYLDVVEQVDEEEEVARGDVENDSHSFGMSAQMYNVNLASVDSENASSEVPRAHCDDEASPLLVGSSLYSSPGEQQRSGESILVNNSAHQNNDAHSELKRPKICAQRAGVQIMPITNGSLLAASRNLRPIATSKFEGVRNHEIAKK